jgi:hypothetical protein
VWPLRAYLDAIKRAKPAICRLLQEVRCAALLLHETVWRVFAYLKACAQFLLEPRGHVEPPADEFFHKPEAMSRIKLGLPKTFYESPNCVSANVFWSTRVSRADIFATVQLMQGTAPIETLGYFA